MKNLNKLMVPIIISIITTFTLTTAFAATSIGDGVYIDAELPRDNYEVSVYDGAINQMDIYTIAGIISDDPISGYNEADYPDVVAIYNDRATLLISRPEPNWPLESSNIIYDSDAANTYSMLFDRAAAYFSGIDTSGELSFMSKADVINKCSEILSALMPGLTPVCSRISAYTAQDLETVRTYLYESDSMYRLLLENGKYNMHEKFEQRHEAYYLSFEFGLDGIPVYGADAIGLKTYTDTESPLAQKCYCSIAVNQGGIIELELHNCVRVGDAAETGKLIPVLTAAEKAAQRFNDLILSSNIVLNKVELEYMPIVSRDETIRFVPVWSFNAIEEDQPKYIIDCCRINALTGDVVN